VTRTWPAALGLGLLTAAALAGLLSATTPAFAQYTPAAALAHGRTLFTGACASCHGVRGQGAGMDGLGIPRLDAQGTAWRLSDVDLALLIRDGKGAMAGVGDTWSKEDIATVLTLLRSWWTPEQLRTHDTAAPATPP